MSTPENEPDAAYHVGQFAQQHKFKLMLMISEMIYFFFSDDIVLLFVLLLLVGFCLVVRSCSSVVLGDIVTNITSLLLFHEIISYQKQILFLFLLHLIIISYKIF